MTSGKPRADFFVSVRACSYLRDITTSSGIAMIIATRRHRKLLKRIRAAVQAGKSKKAEWLIVEWLRSLGAKRLAVRFAYRGMPSHRRPNKSELDAIAAGLDPFTGTDEVVLANMQAKEDQPDDYRLTMDFGIRNRVYNTSYFSPCARS